jgi:prophage antirepressor-like protein
MKRLPIFILCMTLLLITQSTSSLAQDVLSTSFDHTVVSEESAVFTSNKTGYVGPLSPNENPLLEVYDKVTYPEIMIQGDAIAIKALFNIAGTNHFLATIYYDDNTQEAHKFYAIDTEADPVFVPLVLNAGRKISQISLSHGGSGLSIEIQGVYIRHAYGLIHTLSNGDIQASQLILDGASVTHDLLFMNYNHSASFDVNAVISGIELTLSKHVTSIDTAPGGGTFLVTYSIGGWNESVSFNQLTRDITKFSVPVPAAMRGQKIDKVVIRDGQWSVIRKINYIATPQQAKPTSSKVLIDGQSVSFDAYNINGSNYFKLRDIAKALTLSDKKFEVGFDSQINAISITTNKSYTLVGGELAIASNPTTKTANKTASRVFVNTREVDLNIYNINGNNYFKLRDLGTALGFSVEWNGTTNVIEIKTK